MKLSNEMGKAMKDKLAEEILKTSCAENKVFLTSNEWHTIIEAMQTFHEAKMKQITDDDIKKWALYDREYLIDYEVTTSSELNQRLKGREEGAKAIRNGVIVSFIRDDKTI